MRDKHGGFIKKTATIVVAEVTQTHTSYFELTFQIHVIVIISIATTAVLVA